MDYTEAEARAMLPGRYRLTDNQGVMDPSGQDVRTDTVNVLTHCMISRGSGEVSG
jgi:hypothetical protein